MRAKIWIAALLGALILAAPASLAQYPFDFVRVYKTMTLAEVGPFEFEQRAYILETIDELSRVVRSLPDRNIVATLKTDTIGGSPILDLVDHDRDGRADSFVYSETGGGGSRSQDFGYMFDLNADGVFDYVVFSQGTAIAMPFKLISTYYHMIDSNYDGRVDIWIRPDTDLDQDGAVDEGVFTWLYDIDFDGRIDGGDYLGIGVGEPMECDDDVLQVECVFTKQLNVGDAEILAWATRMLADINEGMDQ